MDEGTKGVNPLEEEVGKLKESVSTRMEGNAHAPELLSGPSAALWEEGSLTTSCFRPKMKIFLETKKNKKNK